MGNNFDVTLPNLKESAGQYQEIAEALSGYIETLENVRKNLSKQAYSDLRSALISIEQKGTENVNTLKSMNSALYTIIQLYENAEKKLLNTALDNGNKDPKDVLKTLDKLLESFINMLKGLGNECCKYGADPINFATGNFIYHRAYLRLKGLYPVVFKMFYNSMEKRDGVLGKGWVHNYQIYIRREDSRAILHWSDGREETFIKMEDGTYLHFIGKHDLLKETDEGMLYETTLGAKYYFDQEGKNTRVEDCNGKYLELTYDSAGRLKEVKSVSGESLFYKYNEDNLLIGVSDSEGRKVSLSYENGALTEVKDEENHTFRYCYDVAGNLAVITNGRNIDTIRNEYDEKGRVTRQSYPDGNQVLLEYEDATQTVHVTEQNGNRIAYLHDAQMRSVETVFADGKIQYAYNDQNQQTEMVDKKGNRTKYLYDAVGNLTEIENPLGEKVEMAYNAMKLIKKIKINGVDFQLNEYDHKGNLILRKDGLGRGISLTYNEYGKPIEVQQPDGSMISLSYDAHGNIQRIKEPMGGETHYAYNGLGQVVATIDGNGNRTEYTYNLKGNITSVKNAEGNVRQFFYNESDKVVCIKEFDGSEFKREYNAINKPMKLIDQEGNVTTLEYDSMFNVTRRIDANGGETRFIYDKLNRLACMINPKGHKICYEYDANGNRTKIIDADGTVVKLNYDALNRLIEVEDADGAVSRMEYNHFGQRTKMIDAMGNVRRVIYDKAGQKISSIDAKGNETKYRYNALGKISEVIDPIGRKMKYEYLLGGLLKKVTYPDGTYVSYTYDKNRNVKSKQNHEGFTLFYSYDAMNRIEKIESSQGQTKHYSYDAMGNVKSVIDANGNTTWYTYTSSGHLLTITDTMGNRTEYSYDEMGSLTEVCQWGNQEELLEATALNKNNHNAHFVKYERDVLGNVTTITDALGKKENYIYDARGRMIEKIDQEGLSTKYDYTPGGQLCEIQYEDGNAVKFSYNALKQLTQIKDWLGITTIALDELGRVQKVIDHAGRETIYTRGAMGQRLSIQYPGGKKVEYGYDELLRLTSLRDENGVFAYEYNDSGKLERKLFPNGVRADYTYGITGNLKGLSYQDEAGIIDSYTYQYDMAQNKTSIKRIRRDLPEESGTYDYKYDALNRLVEVAKDDIPLRSYGYDAFGNRTFFEGQEERIAYTYNEANQLIRAMGEESIIDYTYDGRGNLTEIVESGRLKQAYAYNSMNRMVRAINGDQRESIYEYNGLGQRVSQQIFEGDDSPVQSIEYVLDQTKRYNNMLSRIEGDSTHEFVWDGTIAAEKSQEGVHYYLSDELGSPLRYLDAHGKITESYHFDEFGNDTLEKPEEEQCFGYAGYYKDTVAGTYFSQAREYDAQNGRFRAKDIIRGIQTAPYTLNEYTYCWNRPLNFVDRDGAFPSLSDVQEWVSEAGDAIGNWVGDTVNSIGDGISDVTTSFFNGADYVMDNFVPPIVKDAMSGAGNLVIGAGRDLIEIDVFGYSISDAMADLSQTWVGEAFLEAVNFERTSDGVYHTNPNCWQAPLGYNDFYDYVFDAATSMDKNKSLPFTTEDGTTYTIWMWKGDYLNLGAGCETGIYYGDGYHLNSATDTNLHMTLSLYDKNTGDKIFEYSPDDPQWWITGFNPEYQDVDMNDLEVRGSIDFSENQKLWEAFCTGKMKGNEGWCFDEENKVAYYKW